MIERTKMKPSPSYFPGLVLGLALLVAGCDKGAGSGPSAALPSAASPSAPAYSSPAPSAAAPPGSLSSAIAGTWRQTCLPFLPGDGASDITYTISLQGTDRVRLEGVAKDYKNTSCSGGGSVIAKPSFVQKIAGTATVAGLPVLKLVDDGAAASAPADSKSIVGIDKGQLRFGNASGARGSDGFPSQFERPAEAYNKQ